MLFRTRLVSLLSVLVAVIALAPQLASAQDGVHHSIKPGQSKVFMCGWGYGPIAEQHALRAAGDLLKVRKVTRTSPNSIRVIFSHKVIVREDGGGRYRAIFNRGHLTVSYRDDCPGGGASY